MPKATTPGAILLLVLTFAPTLVESSSAECDYYADPAVEVGEFYLHTGFRELWQESNDIPGLQRQQTFCSDGSSLPRDVCITHSAHYAQIACLMLYPGTL